MEENRDEKAAASGGSGPAPLSLDFLRREKRPEPTSSRKPLVWGGLILALLLMFAGTGIATFARKRWGMYLFAAAALLYLVCRCTSIGLVNTMPKLLTLLLMLAGCLLIAVWRLPSPLGILGVACLAAAFVLILLFGLGYVGRDRKKREDAP